ncbi:MAG: imelysin family protein, partial [Cyanobacteria bacterium J06633_2]
IITDFVDQVLIPNYQYLTQQTGALSEAITAFVADPNSSTLQAARDTWLDTRHPWEQSEAFAFGPAASLGLDADLDDWPLNEADVLAILNSADELTPEYIDGLQTSQKGFHAIGFMLFGLDNDKSLSEFTERELEYLGAIALVFDQTANALLSSWIIGVDGFPAYRSEFVNAGAGSNAYLTLESAGEEIIQGIIGILDELGNIKIGEAVDAQNPFLLEARFAHSSLADFEDNLISARNTYLGDMPARGTDGRGISEFVSSVDPALHAEILQQMDVAMAAIQAIPGPIEKTLCDPGAQPQISAARESVLVLFDTFSERVLPFFSSN